VFREQREVHHEDGHLGFGRLDRLHAALPERKLVLLAVLGLLGEFLPERHLPVAGAAVLSVERLRRVPHGHDGDRLHEHQLGRHRLRRHQHCGRENKLDRQHTAGLQSRQHQQDALYHQLATLPLAAQPVNIGA